MITYCRKTTGRSEGEQQDRGPEIRGGMSWTCQDRDRAQGHLGTLFDGDVGKAADTSIILILITSGQLGYRFNDSSAIIILNVNNKEEG